MRYSNYIFGMEPFVFACIVAIFLILIWLAIREFLTWYWKINEIIMLLSNIDRKLDFISIDSDDNFKGHNDNSNVGTELPNCKQTTDPKKTLKEILNKKIF